MTDADPSPPVRGARCRRSLVEFALDRCNAPVTAQRAVGPGLTRLTPLLRGGPRVASSPVGSW